MTTDYHSRFLTVWCHKVSQFSTPSICLNYWFLCFRFLFDYWFCVLDFCLIIKRQHTHTIDGSYTAYFRYSCYKSLQISFTLQEENFHLKLNVAISLMADWLNFNSTNYKIFKNLSMMAYITKIQNWNSLIFNSVNLTILGKVAKLNSVYIFTL